MVRQFPLVGNGVVDGSISVAARAIDLAKRIEHAYDAVRVLAVRPGVAESLEHADERPCGIYGQEDIVEDDEKLEEPRLAETPGLVPTTLVDAIDDDDGDCVDAGNGNGHANVQELFVQLRGNVEWLIPCRLREQRSRKRLPKFARREFEK